MKLIAAGRNKQTCISTIKNNSHGSLTCIQEVKVGGGFHTLLGLDRASKRVLTLPQYTRKIKRLYFAGESKLRKKINNNCK